MSRFFVGQRVRIKWSRNWPYLGGQEGIIVKRCDPDVEEGDWVVAPDCWGDVKPMGDDSEFGPSEEQLEPATDGNTLVGWETCAWKPEHLRDSKPTRKRRTRRAPSEGVPA
jgi:hypothetical protein